MRGNEIILHKMKRLNCGLLWGILTQQNNHFNTDIFLHNSILLAIDHSISRALVQKLTKEMKYDHHLSKNTVGGGKINLWYLISLEWNLYYSMTDVWYSIT